MKAYGICINGSVGEGAPGQAVFDIYLSKGKAEAAAKQLNVSLTTEDLRILWIEGRTEKEQTFGFVEHDLSHFYVEEMEITE